MKLQAEERITAMERVLSHQRAALNAYRHGVMPGGDSKFDHFKIEDFNDMSVKNILIRLAFANEGILKGLDAVRTLMRLGLIPDRKSADAQVYTLLNREKEFVKIQPGEYRLSEEAMESMKEPESEDVIQTEPLPNKE